MKGILVAVVCMLSGLCFAADKERVNIVLIDIAPSAYKENGKSLGSTYDITKHIAQRAGFDYEIKIKPFPRVVLELGSGAADMSILLENSALQGKVTIVTPIYPIQSIILTNTDFPVRSPSDLDGKRVGVIRNASFHKKLPNYQTLKLYQVANYRQGIKMLRANRIDALVSVDMAIYFSLNKMSISRSEFSIPYVFDKKDILLQVSDRIATPEQLKKMRTIVAEMKANGSMEEIISRYLGSE
ncbi:transporter substrate-binding domain-containing protein [Vibrio profundum]|uniref:substrate-binding periplasmic protein n=1 Tax=Vibrio profundum TaxID=2910247 RepID=UPI003D1470E0